MGERREFRLPDVGEGLTEAEVLDWRVAPGDTVAVNQVLVEIETAKASVELPSPFAGTILDLLVQPGDVVPVGTPIVAVDVGGDGTAAAPAREAAAQGAAAAAPAGESAGESAAAPAAAEPRREAVLVGYGVREQGSAPRRRPRRTDGSGLDLPLPPATPAADPHGSLRPEQGPPGESGRPMRIGGWELGRHLEQRAGGGSDAAEVRVRAKPPVRRLAKELGVDLAAVDATGAHGDVTRGDVERAARLRSDLSPAARAGGGAVGAGGAYGTPAWADGMPAADERLAVRGVVRTMAEAMVRSAFTAPHVTEWVDVDVSESVALLGRLRSHPALADVRVTPLTLVALGLLRAVARHPRINASWDEAAQEIVVRHRVNLGIAAATPRGLLVPNVKDAHTLGLVPLAAALGELVESAREGTLTPAQLTGGTITITNVGVFGVDGGTPILNPGEAAILAMGRILDRPWVVDGAVVARPVMELSLSFDHRHVDGALGSQVLADVAAFLADPTPYLLLG